MALGGGAFARTSVALGDRKAERGLEWRGWN